MGSRKLDSACYLYQGLRALHDMAETLDYPDDARRYAARLEEFAHRFEIDWWLEEEGMYADSLHTDGHPQFDGHWTVVLPLQLGMASPERARRAMARIEREWVNRWGMVHTGGREELVWTLPTGLLALTAFRCDQPGFGVRLLQNIAETASYGTLGAFKELIPIGLCFVQLWSAGLYLQGVIEGLLGLQPLAHLHRLAISPRLPASWPWVRVNRLMVGEHTLTLRATPASLEMQHDSGPEPLDVRYHVPGSPVSLQHHVAYGPEPQLVKEGEEYRLQAMVAPGQRLVVNATPKAIIVRMPDRREEGAANGVESAEPASTAD